MALRQGLAKGPVAELGCKDRTQAGARRAQRAGWDALPVPELLWEKADLLGMRRGPEGQLE